VAPQAGSAHSANADDTARRSLARFAASHCAGDPHALNRDRPVDATLRRALAILDDEPTADASGAEARRARYDRWGLGCDELSSTVLCAGLRPRGATDQLADALLSAASAGEPRVVTLRELRGLNRLHCGTAVWTCENPDVVAAAVDALGSDCPALICTGGWPSPAAGRRPPACGCCARSARRTPCCTTTVTSISRACASSIAFSASPLGGCGG